MKIHPNEMWLFLDYESSMHKKTRALAKSITANINEFSYEHNKLSKLRWAEILIMLNMKPKDLLNKADPKYQKEIAGHEFDEQGWLDIIQNNPAMIKGAIAIMDGKAVLCVNPNDIYKLSPQHKELNS